MEEIQICSAQAEDYEAIHAIMVEAQNFHVLLEPDYFRSPSAMFSKEQFEELINQNIVLTAKYGAVVVGCVILQRRNLNSPTKYPRKSLYIDSMAVTSVHRDKGIGTLLLDAVKKIAREEKVDCLELQVYKENKKAVQLYKRFGFSTRAMNMEMKLD